MSLAHGHGRDEPLTSDDPRYVEPHGVGASQVVERVQKGLTPLLLVGHRGVGKSTVLRRAAGMLSDDGYAVVLNLRDLPQVDPSRILYDLASFLVRAWVQDGPEEQPSPFLVQDLRSSDPEFPQGQGRSLPPVEIARAALTELVGASPSRERLPLLIDGLDRLPVAIGREIAERLLAVRDLASVVLVASPALSVGPGNVALLDAYRVVYLSPVDVASDRGAAFLERVARAHIGALPHATAPLIARSGGVLSDLVGLLQDTLSYAGRPDDLDEITDDHVRSACDDRTDRLRRLLLAGDRAALSACTGLSGAEVPADRKVRLLQHGFLLEYGVGSDIQVRPHPLVTPLLERP